MKATICRISSMIVFLAVATGVFGQKSAQEKEGSRKEAERLWELAVHAQGGRERLYSVENMVVVSKSKVQYSLFKSYDHVLEYLYVFPNKIWQLDDHRPSVLGIIMQMDNFETRQMYLVGEGRDNTVQKPISQSRMQEMLDSEGNVKWVGMCDFLLETKWWKPVPQSASVGKINGKNVDVVQTVLNGTRIDFYLDQKTHLPVRHVIFNYYPSDKNVREDITDFADYIKVDGLLMPSKRKLHYPTSGSETLSYQINVPYDEKIFVTPPLPIETAADAWKPKTKNK